MPKTYNVTIYDKDGTRPLAAVSATALTDGGNDIVELVRDTIETDNLNDKLND